jgi:indolepyruvate ferredoxin oxidoreductase
VRLLTAYQDRDYALRYRKLVQRVALRERDLRREGVAMAVARSYARLLAYKDEYEVARLYCQPEFERQLKRTFADGYRLEFTLALPFTKARDPDTGRPLRRRFGGWILPLMRLLQRMRWLRQTRWDPFAHSADRRLERNLIADYEAVLDIVLARLDEENFELAIEILSISDRIRGFGPIKQASAEQVQRERQRLLDRYTGKPADRREAA